MSKYDHLKNQSWHTLPNCSIYANFVSQGTFLLYGFRIEAPNGCVVTKICCGVDSPSLSVPIPSDGIFALAVPIAVPIGICFGVTIQNQNTENAALSVTPIGDYDAATKEKWRTIYELNGWKISWED